MPANKFPEISGNALALAKNTEHLGHAMQSGVRLEIEREFPAMPPELQRHLKHLRVGVNMAMNEVSAMQWCLIDAGIITHEDFFLRLTRLLQLEVELYEKRLKDRYGIDVKLG